MNMPTDDAGHDAPHTRSHEQAEQTSPGAAIDVVALYSQHRGHLLRFVHRYVGNHEDAEDVVQNTFIEAVRCAHRFSGLSKPSTWLFGIALNLARNQVRRNVADRYEMVDENFMEQLVDANADPAMQYERRQIAQKVDDLLDALPAKIRSTFEAVLDGDSTYEEAARQLQIPIGTVRSRVSRVRAAVRSEYGDTPPPAA
ncbi:MAG: RNA polymerase sigma factor [Alcaligenaceae bacterium]|nr:RNA polymerase sigma factor [Alcaligenaceae bacterium SAGV5]MPS55057.1 RNA polymerase sigma factor [Alcaligenaceae bacterium SAGV3]MPT55574.1 RNA polymerase sigma factor [Alcaligenaceae bacterium]